MSPPPASTSGSNVSDHGHGFIYDEISISISSGGDLPPSSARLPRALAAASRVGHVTTHASTFWVECKRARLQSWPSNRSVIQSLWSRRSRIDHGLVAGPSPARSWRWRRWCWRERQAWRARSSCLLAHTRQAPASRLSTGGGSCCSPSSAQGAPSLDAHVVGRLSAPLPTPPRLSCAWRARNSYLLAHTRQAPASRPFDRGR